MIANLRIGYRELPCIKCRYGHRKGYGEFICSQPGFRPRPISRVHNCASLNNYRKYTSSKLSIQKY